MDVHTVIEVDSDSSDTEELVARKRAAVAGDESTLRGLAALLQIDPDGAGLQRRVIASRSTRPRRQFVNAAPLFREAQMMHHDRNRVLLELNTPRTHAEVSGDPRYHTRRSDGSANYRRYCNALESFGMTRTFLQVMMHDLAANVMGSLFYGDEWEQERARILEENNWRDLAPLMAAVCARRFGKTVGTAQLAASTMLAKGDRKSVV